MDSMGVLLCPVAVLEELNGLKSKGADPIIGVGHIANVHTYASAANHYIANQRQLLMQQDVEDNELRKQADNLKMHYCDRADYRIAQ